jgi:hypothetical protein
LHVTSVLYRTVYHTFQNGAERSSFFDWWNGVRKKEKNQVLNDVRVPCKDSSVYYGNKERMFRTMEIKEYFDMDPIMYYMNTCTALTNTHTGFVCTGLLATFTCTCRYRYKFQAVWWWMYVCMENFVLYGTRTALTDTNTLCLHAVTGNFYVYVYIQIRVVSCTMTNVTERRILNCGTENISRNEHTDFKWIRVRHLPVYWTMEAKECFKFWKQKNIFFLQLGNEIGVRRNERNSSGGKVDFWSLKRRSKGEKHADLTLVG